jgi:hypothetical protein
MATFVNQPSMAAGEIGPELYGRVDQEMYYIGLRTCENFIVRQYGGVMNRSGSDFIAEQKDSSHLVRIIPFQFNELQTYVLEFGNQTMRVVKNGGEVIETAAIVNITAATNAAQVVVSAANTFSNGDDVFISGMVGMVEMNGRTLRISDVTGANFKLKDFQGNYINSTNYGTYTSGGTSGRVYTVATPWVDTDLFNLNYAQSADVITIVHPNYMVKDITRTAHDAWTVTDFNVSNGPFKDINITTTNVLVSATTGSITIASSANMFTTDDVGTLFYVEQDPEDGTPTWEVAVAVTMPYTVRAGANYYKALNNATTGTVKPDHTEGSATDGATGVRWEYLHSGFGIAKITAFTDAQHVTATVIKTMPDNLLTITSKNWAKAAWSKTEGYPSAVSYHKQRLWLGGTPNLPNYIWCSNVAARTEFGMSNPVLDDESITLALDTTQVNAIRHLMSLKALIVLTSSSEQALNGNRDNAILASSPPTPDVQGYDGVSKVRPIIIGNTALVVDSTGDLVRSVRYDLNSDTYTGIDMTARSPHIFRNKQIVDWAFQKRPFSMVWTIFNDGTMAGFTFMDEQKVYAWHRHTTQGTYESVCSIREGNSDAVYKIVRRLVNGTYRRYLERDTPRYFSTVLDGSFVDCGLSYDGRNTDPTSTITVTGGTTWDSPEVLTLTCSKPIFVAKDIQNSIEFVNGNITYRLIISGYTSPNIVSAIPSKKLPVAYQNVARSDYGFGKVFLGPFHHLEGKELAVLSDGNVIENLVVTNGLLTLLRPGVVTHAGLGYIPQIETLDMAYQGGQSKAKSVNIPRIFLTVQESRAAWVATNKYGNTSMTATTNVKQALINDGFYEIKGMQRTPDIGYDAAIPVATDIIEVNTNGSWSNRGRVCVRQPFPLPITINCITEEVPIGYS